MNIRRRRRPRNGMNVFPLIDMVFLLLIYFLLTSKFITQTTHSINLPKSTVSKKLEKEPIVIHVTRDESIYLNRDKRATDIAALQSILTGELAEFDEKPSVVIKGDQKISLGLTIRLLDIVKASGGESVDITTIKAGE